LGDRAAKIEAWVKKRPYLEEIAKLHVILAAVEEESASLESEAVPDLSGRKGVLEELQKGIPLLRGEQVDGAILEKAAALLEKMAEALVKAPLTEKINLSARQAGNAFKKEDDLARQVISAVLESAAPGSSNADLGEADEGFIIFLAWRALSGALKPLQGQLATLLEGQLRWRRGYCPLCGQLPAMGHLVRPGKGKGRERNLLCSCCGMSWSYQRIGCPFCGNTEQKQLNIIGLDNEPSLRIDTCDGCGAYLKTYTGEGEEGVALADWSTLHLDLVAQEKGFKRTGYQMYTL